MEIVPVNIERDGDSAIEIRWSNDTTSHWTVHELRKTCPCATCREKRREGQPAEEKRSGPVSLPVLSAAEAKPLRIESMRPVGTYAYNIVFSDGHSSGIFTFALLSKAEGK